MIPVVVGGLRETSLVPEDLPPLKTYLIIIYLSWDLIPGKIILSGMFSPGRLILVAGGLRETSFQKIYLPLKINIPDNMFIFPGTDDSSCSLRIKGNQFGSRRFTSPY